jgi:hypothetical protein
MTKLLIDSVARHVLRKAVRPLIPKQLRSGGELRDFVTLSRHMLFDYGWLRSHRENCPVSRDGEPLPWFTYPAIDYLNQLDMSEMDVFEWGSGYSTVFWSKRAKSVVSIETNPTWANRVKKLVNDLNCAIVMTTESVTDYVDIISNYSKFDIIIIDGTGESRRSCALVAPKHLNRDGIIVVDNTDRWPRTAEVLRNADFIEVDFTGFSPGGASCHTTSIFFSREFRGKPQHDVQPIRSVAQPNEPWPGE